MTDAKLDASKADVFIELAEGGGWLVVLTFPAVEPEHDREIMASQSAWSHKPDAIANAAKLRRMLTRPRRKANR